MIEFSEAALDKVVVIVVPLRDKLGKCRAERDKQSADGPKDDPFLQNT